MMGGVFFCVSCPATFDAAVRSDPASYRYYQTASQSTGGAIIPFLFLGALLVGLTVDGALGYWTSRSPMPLRLFLYAVSLLVMLLYPALFSYWLLVNS